jgi:hypothetical protein
MEHISVMTASSHVNIDYKEFIYDFTVLFVSRPPPSWLLLVPAPVKHAAVFSA